MNDDVRAGQNQRGSDEENGGGQIAGNRQAAAFEARAAFDSNDALRGDNARSEFTQGELEMIASGNRFVNRGFAFGIESGEENR